MFLHQALQDYKKQSDCIIYWIRQINKFLKSKHYSVESYNTLCQEIYQTWPVDSLTRIEYLSDCIVKKVSFAPVYYALTLRQHTGFETISDTKIKCGDKIIEGSWFRARRSQNSYSSLQYPSNAATYERLNNNNCSPGVIFLKDNKDIFWYFTEVVFISFVIFHVLAMYWESFQEVSQDNIDIFAKYRKEQDMTIHKQYLGNNAIYFWCIHKVGEEDENPFNNIETPKNVPMCKILRDCLDWSAKGLKYYIQVDYERED